MAENEWVILATFENESAADEAITALKKWDKANDDIKLGAIGSIYKKDDKVKTHLSRKTGRGAKVGAALGVIAAVLSGGITLVAGVVSGSVLGAIAGSFFKKSPHLTMNEVQTIGTELDAGRVAVVVACDEPEVGPTSTQLTAAGGSVKTYLMPPELLNETARAIEASDPEAAASEAAASDAAADESAAV